MSWAGTKDGPERLLEPRLGQREGGAGNRGARTERGTADAGGTHRPGSPRARWYPQQRKSHHRWCRLGFFFHCQVFQLSTHLPAYPCGRGSWMSEAGKGTEHRKDTKLGLPHAPLLPNKRHRHAETTACLQHRRPAAAAPPSTAPTSADVPPKSSSARKTHLRIVLLKARYLAPRAGSAVLCSAPARGWMQGVELSDSFLCNPPHWHGKHEQHIQSHSRFYFLTGSSPPISPLPSHHCMSPF